MSPDDNHRLALALETLNGTVQTGFATIRGDINLLSRAEHENGKSIESLDKRVSDLEGRRFPLPTIGGIMGVAGVLVSVVALATKGG